MTLKLDVLFLLIYIYVCRVCPSRGFFFTHMMTSTHCRQRVLQSLSSLCSLSCQHGSAVTQFIARFLWSYLKDPSQSFASVAERLVVE